MPTCVVAAAQDAGLRGPAHCVYKALLDELAAQGCAAMGYWLTGPDPLPRLRVKRLRAQDQVIVAFPTVDEAWIVVAPHRDDDPGRPRVRLAVSDRRGAVAMGGPARQTTVLR